MLFIAPSVQIWKLRLREMICPLVTINSQTRKSQSIQLLILGLSPGQSHFVPPTLWQGSSWWVQTQQEYWDSVGGSERLLMISEP